MSPQEKEGKERKRMKIVGGLSVSFLLLGGNNKNAPYRRKGSLASQFQVTNYYCGKTRTEEEWHMFLACLLAFSLLSNAIQDTVPGEFCCWKWPESVNNQTPTTQTCPLAILICIMPQ